VESSLNNNSFVRGEKKRVGGELRFISRKKKNLTEKGNDAREEETGVLRGKGRKRHPFP